MREAVRVLAEALAADLSRIATLAATVPIVAGEASAAPVATVYDATVTAWVARGQVPPAGDPALVLPCALVRLSGDATYAFPARTAADGARVLGASLTLAVQYVARDNDTLAGLAACSRWLRAARAWALDWAAAPESARTLGGVAVALVVGARLVEAYRDEDADTITGALLLDCTTREIVPALP